MIINSQPFSSYQFDGTFQVKNAEDELTLDFTIYGVSLNSTEIYDWRGSIKDSGY